MSVEKDVKSGMQTALDHLSSELKGLRTSRANPALVENVQISVYGTSMSLRDLANITVPESRQLLITPYDASNVTFISKGIENANLNLMPQVDGHVIRINIPPMDEARRKEMVKRCKGKGEEAKIAVREARRKFNEIVRKKKESSEIAEDEMKREEKMIQDLTDKFCKEVDELCIKKEKEILEI